MNYKQALEYLENGKIDFCIDFFKDSGNRLEYGYSLMLKGKLEGAANILSSINSIRADWAIKLIPIMQGYLGELPTYFQVRNFLEIDITLLFKAGMPDYVEYILGAAETFYDINRESYKFFARALLKNGYLNAAKAFLDKSLDVCWRDPELHYLFVEYYMINNDGKNAKKALDNCLEVSPDYFPALNNPLLSNR